MTKNRRQSGKSDPEGLPHYQQLLDGTAWSSLATVSGSGESLPPALAQILDPDPAVRANAARDALGEVTHQNTIYEATVPVALYIAAILGQPDITAGDFDLGTAVPSRPPTLVRMLAWLSDTAYDADDECVAIGERNYGERFLYEYEEMRRVSGPATGDLLCCPAPPRSQERGGSRRSSRRRHSPRRAPPSHRASG
ncbi:hypothetical protein [Streptomyces sp. NPDC051561]|uniref:hypothetical protein n=1 Tax=Streptomyces sp. NPDC051561 TaxID=3365658 RepID=UPI0037B0FF07